MSAFKHIDIDLLNEISDGNKELIADLVSMYTEQFPVFSEQLGTMCATKNYIGLAKLAHKIKGSLSTIGITMLAAHMKELELLAREGKNPELYQNYIVKYRTISDEAIVELKKHLKQI